MSYAVVCPPQTQLINKNETPSTRELQLHQAEVLAVKFSPHGRHLLTASADKLIHVTSAFEPHDILLTLKGHKKAVLDAYWSHDGDRIFSCSADLSAALWDASTGQRIKRLHGHDDIINTCCIGRQLPNIAVTGSDDGATKIWDLRVFKSVATFTERYQVLSVALDDTMYRAFSGSLDNKIRIFDIRKVTISPPSNESTQLIDPALLLTLSGHINAITSISLTSDHGVLASNSMDQTIRLWDVRPFCSRRDDHRCFAAIRGPTHNFEQTLHRVQWNSDDTAIAAGSADRSAYIFGLEGVESGAQAAKLLYKLPGHLGAVTEVSFHPTESLVATGGTDKLVYLRRLAKT